MSDSAEPADDEVAAEDTTNDPRGTEAPADPEVPPESPPTDEGDGLPEWEPLTPELVEDEAIRGDFMLRWAVMLLALLMGWTVIRDTSVLTHIRAGDALIANGFLPTGRDTLSFTAGENRWVHLDWLFDLGIAGFHRLFGDDGLSVIKALLSATIFSLLLRISLPGVPTWWGSVCAALALIASFPSLTATPAIITLLGVAILLWLLFQVSQSSQARYRWGIVATMLLWCQLDDRAWIGGLLLISAAIGNLWDTRSSSAEATAKTSRSLILVALAGVGVMLVHPFGWETWLSGLKLYQLEYPAQQAYAITTEVDYFRHFPAWMPQFWTINYFNGAALLLWVVSLTVLILNRLKVPASHWAMFVSTTILCAAGGAELAAGSLVFAALANVNAQRWYVENFRQTYSVDTAELLFSRGGRAITVISLFVLGFAMVAGYVTGQSGRRVGTGFNSELQQEIFSYQDVLEGAIDDRPFSFRPSQGDVLNWIGKHPFIDSRLRLFASTSPSIVEQHLQARRALRIPRDGSPQNRVAWQTVLDTYQITQALPRLSGENPDYVTFGDLMFSGDWELTRLGAETAVFCRSNTGSPQVQAFVEQHRQDFVESVFRSRENHEIVGESSPTWPRAPSLYSQYFYQPAADTPAPIQQARHDLKLAEMTTSPDQMIATTYAAIRNIHRGISEAPNDYNAYAVLGGAYARLWNLEQSLMQARELVYPAAMRYLQTTSAYHHAATCQPDNPLPHLRLFGIYAEQQRQDLALHHLDEFSRLRGSMTLLPETHPDFAAQQQQMEEFRSQLASAVEEIQASSAEDLAAGISRATLAQSLADSGFPLTALDVIESDKTILSGDPALNLLYARLLGECGRTSAAFDQFQLLEQVDSQGQLPDWKSYAAFTQVVSEDLRTALSTLATEQRSLNASSTMVLLQQRPLQATGPTSGTQPADALAPVVNQMQLSTLYFDQLLPRLEANEFNQALIRLELGMNDEAAGLLQGLLERNPASPLRPVAESYLLLLDNDVELPPLPEVIEINDDLAAVTIQSSESDDPRPQESEKSVATPGATSGTQDDDGQEPAADSAEVPAEKNRAGESKPDS